MHRRTAGNDHRWAPATDEFSSGVSRQVSRERIHASVRMLCDGAVMRIESRLHVLHGVSATRDDRERAYSLMRSPPGGRQPLASIVSSQTLS